MDYKKLNRGLAIPNMEVFYNYPLSILTVFSLKQLKIEAQHSKSLELLECFTPYAELLTVVILT